MIELGFSVLTENERLYKDFLNEWFLEVQKVLKTEKGLLNKERLKTFEMSAVFVPKKQIKKLNKDFRAKNKETDVLSFDGDGMVSLGELIFCMEVIKDKAKKLKLPIRYYLAMLMTHGVLHLFGYDHELNEAEELKMFKLQDKIMRKVASKLAPGHKTSFDIL